MSGKFRVLRRMPAVAAAFLLLSFGTRVLSAQGARNSPAGEDAPRHVGDHGVSRPEKISGKPPEYTEIARKSGIRGAVIVEAIIDERGNVTNARILKSLPLGLDQAALDAVQRWKFKPAMFEGRPVKVYYTLTVNFQVEGAVSYGPLFRKFLGDHADFAAALADQRYQDAGQWLDRKAAEQPAASEISLARCYLLLKQDRFPEAWQEAERYRGADPFEAFYAVGLFAARSLLGGKSSSPQARAETIELGLQAETRAMAVKPGCMAPIAYKVQLLLEKAKLASDPKESADLNAEAGQLQEQAKKIYVEIIDPFGTTDEREPG